MATYVLPPAFIMSERLRPLREALQAGAALAAADSLGVLTRLEVGPADPLELAHDCRIGERGARLLLAALAGLGLVEAGDDGAYRATATDLSRLGAVHALWGTLPEAIRTDRPSVAGDSPAGAERLYPDFVPQLGAMHAPEADQAAGRLAAAGPRTLDVGAGAAPWSIAMAARDSTRRVTAVDLPAVLPATRRAVAAAGLEAQFQFLGGDLFEVAWGQDAFDLAIAGNVCHLFDEAGNRRLLGRLFNALCPGGVLAIVDALPNERMDGPSSVTLYALGLLLRTRAGRVYPFSTYVGWLRDAGFEGIERFDLSPDARHTLITARRNA